MTFMHANHDMLQSSLCVIAHRHKQLKQAGPAIHTATANRRAQIGRAHV